jgi:DNA-binding MarR family transcriptional regulator
MSEVRIAYLIGRLDRALRRKLPAALASFGLTLPQYTALSVLKVHERLSNAELAERSFMTPQSANEMVQAMVAKALIGRDPDPEHRRIIRLRLTADGRRTLRKADGAVLNIERRMLGNLPRSEQTKLRAHLNQCLQGLLES